jgi:hypothetical protein
MVFEGVLAVFLMVLKKRKIEKNWFLGVFCGDQKGAPGKIN